MTNWKSVLVTFLVVTPVYLFTGWVLHRSPLRPDDLVRAVIFGVFYTLVFTIFGAISRKRKLRKQQTSTYRASPEPHQPRLTKLLAHPIIRSII